MESDSDRFPKVLGRGYRKLGRADTVCPFKLASHPTSTQIICRAHDTQRANQELELKPSSTAEASSQELHRVLESYLSPIQAPTLNTITARPNQTTKASFQKPHPGRTLEKHS